MNSEDILRKVQDGRMSVEEALKHFGKQPFEEMNYAKPDIHREVRTGFAEVIFCQGKPDEYIVSIFTPSVFASSRLVPSVMNLSPLYAANIALLAILFIPFCAPALAIPSFRRHSHKCFYCNHDYSLQGTFPGKICRYQCNSIAMPPVFYRSDSAGIQRLSLSTPTHMIIASFHGAFSYNSASTFSASSSDISPRILPRT